MRSPVILLLALAFPAVCGAQAISPTAQTNVSSSGDALWQVPGDIHKRDLFFGVGGQNGRAKGQLSYLHEDMGGTKPKFVVVDESGKRWKVKLGYEAQPEVVATRLLWALGYFTDEDYYEPSIKVDGMRHLRRGQGYVKQDGTVKGA